MLLFTPQGDMEEVRTLVGVSMGVMSGRQHSGGGRTDAAKEKERVCLRFYAALVLLDLIQEVTTMQQDVHQCWLCRLPSTLLWTLCQGAALTAKA